MLLTRLVAQGVPLHVADVPVNIDAWGSPQVTPVGGSHEHVEHVAAAALSPDSASNAGVVVAGQDGGEEVP